MDEDEIAQTQASYPSTHHAETGMQQLLIPRTSRQQQVTAVQLAVQQAAQQQAAQQAAQGLMQMQQMQHLPQQQQMQQMQVGAAAQLDNSQQYHGSGQLPQHWPGAQQWAAAGSAGAQQWAPHSPGSSSSTMAQTSLGSWLRETVQLPSEAVEALIPKLIAKQVCEVRQLKILREAGVLEALFFSAAELQAVSAALDQLYPPAPPVSEADAPPEPLEPSQHGMAAGNDQTPNFRWSACHRGCLLVRQPTIWPMVQLQAQLQLPLLYWAERSSWLWHKKWTLPKLHVKVSCNGKPVGGDYVMNPGEPPMYAVVSAGTLHDGSEGEGSSLHDQGLGGECQRRLVAGETTFSSLLFRHTSFNCGKRPFHLVVAVHAPAHHPLAVAALRRSEATLLPNTAADGAPGAPSQQQMVSLACSCSSPIIVNARKRTKGERPDADASDVRLMPRQRGMLAHSQRLAMQPQPAVHQGQCMPPMGPQGGYSAQPQMWQPPGPHMGTPQAPQPIAGAEVPVEVEVEAPVEAEVEVEVEAEVQVAEEAEAVVMPAAVFPSPKIGDEQLPEVEGLSPPLNSLLHEDSTSESEREGDEYVEQVQRFRTVFKRKVFSANSLDLEGWEPAEDDATASTASASEAFGDRCMQVGAQGHQHASLGRGEGVVRSDEGQHWVQEAPAPAVLAPSSWSGPSVKPKLHYDVVKLKLGPPSGPASELVKRTLGETSPISLISPPSPTEVAATEAAKEKEGEAGVEVGTTANGQEAEERVVEEEQSRPASTMEEKRPTSSRPTRAKTRRGFLRSESKSYDRTIIGKRIRVYWEWNRVWYPGVVKDYAPAGELHTVCYDDGDQRDEPLNFNGAIQWELLSTATAT